MKKILIILNVSGALILTMAVFFIADTAGWFTHRTAQVVKQEVDPSELLRKYAWLKSAMTSLDSKKATLDANASKIKDLETVPRHQWSEADAVQYNQ